MLDHLKLTRIEFGILITSAIVVLLSIIELVTKGFDRDELVIIIWCFNTILMTFTVGNVRRQRDEWMGLAKR